MCYCQTGGAALEKSVSEATTKIPALESSIEEAGAAKTQLATDLVAHKADREAAKTAMAEATSVREKQASEYAKESAEAKANIEAMGKAIAALERGMKGGFLQTEAATVLRKMDLTTFDMDDGDRDTLSAFLQAGSKGGSQGTGEIVGILKQMKETAEKDLNDSTAAEQTAIADHEQLVAAKTEEVDALTKMIEVKTVRFGDVGVQLVNLAADLDDTQKALAEDQKFLADLDKQCKHQKETWAVR
jgi:chromosome segregation ATPase